MKRKQFITNISKLGIAAIIAPKLLMAKEKESGLHAPTFPLDSKELNMIDWGKTADKYLNEKVRNFQAAMETTIVERPDLEFACMQVIVKKEIVEESDIEKFCYKINKCEQEGLIEYARLANVCSLKLAGPGAIIGWNNEENKPIKLPADFPRRHMLFFYTFSKYSLAERKARGNKYFVMEGELTNTEI